MIVLNERQRRAIFAGVLLTIVSIGACCSGFLTQPGTFKAEPVMETVGAVIERHDAYLDTFDLKGEEAMRQESAQLLFGLQSQPTVSKAWFQGAFEPVATRHDQWVSEDAGLLPYQRRTFLRSTEILRGFYGAE